MKMFVSRLILKAKSGWHWNTVSSNLRTSITSSIMRYKINVFLNNIKSAVFSTGGKCPFGLVPILEVEGVTLCESMAILRFVAKRHGKYFSDLFRSRSLGCHAIRPLLEGALRDIHMNANVRDWYCTYTQDITRPSPYKARWIWKRNVFSDPTFTSNLRINYPPKTELWKAP